jgi:Txe/YoeB family toxin of toxin-antitoxin system
LQAQDRKVLKRINALLVDIQRTGNEGIGKPQALKHDFAGYWSRRITDEHRLVQDRRRRGPHRHLSLPLRIADLRESRTSVSALHTA